MLWIVGRTYSEFENYLVDNAIPFGLLHDERVKTPKTRANEVLLVPFTSQPDLLASLPEPFAPSGFMLAGYEKYVVPLSWLCTTYDLPGPSAAAAKAVTDKSVMRQAFWDSEFKVAPYWQSVNSIQDIESFSEQHQFPLVLKPTNFSKSRFVSIVHDIEALRLAYTSTEAALADSASGMLIEEFMTGTMHTVAGFVDMAGTVYLSDTIVDCIRASDIGTDDSYLAERLIPSELNSSEVAACLQVAKQGVTALGLTGVSLHIELIYTKDGPKIIEIGARLGGYRARMYGLARGISLYAGVVANALNHVPDLQPSKQDYSSVIEIFPSENGTVSAIDNLDALEQFDTVKNIRIGKPVGTPAGRAKDGYLACVTITLASEQKDTLDRARQYVHENVSVTVTP